MSRISRYQIYKMKYDEYGHTVKQISRYLMTVQSIFQGYIG